MINNILVFLWLLLVILILSFVAKKFLIRKCVYPFQNYGKSDLPYITIDIQGHSYNMIIDTGCAVSILCKSALKDIEYSNSKRKISLSAITQDSIDTNAVVIPFKAGNTSLESDFVIIDEDDFGNYQKMMGIKMHGLLGNEFLDATNCKVDYANHTIVLK